MREVDSLFKGTLIGRLMALEIFVGEVLWIMID